MTETCGIITSISGDYFVDKPASCGPAMPAYESKIVNPDTGEEMPAGEPGELWVRGGHVIRGYLNREEATAETIVGGWLRTGDMARKDEDDFIYIVDRIKDMVLRGGENIYCAEVESAIFDHDDVAECTVFGVPDDRLGEEVGIAVFLKEGATATADELRNHCATQLAKFKILATSGLLIRPYRETLQENSSSENCGSLWISKTLCRCSRRLPAGIRKARFESTPAMCLGADSSSLLRVLREPVNGPVRGPLAGT